MFLTFLIQAFLFTALADKEGDIPPVFELPLVVEAAEVSPVEIVEGYDDATAWSFSHSLPKIEDSYGFGPQRIDTGSLGVLTSADSVLVLDRRTWKVLFDKSSNDIRPIASITKMMTALTLLELELDLDLNELITVHASDNRIGGRINIYPGEQFYIRDLWQDALIASDNVAIASLVRSTGLSEAEFVEKMNFYAKEYGLVDSHFVEPTGINSNNVSTAQEVAKLIEKAMSKNEIVDTVRRPIYSFSPLNKSSVRTVKSTNKLLKSFVNEDPYSIVGGKTGFTFEAGYCLGVIVDGPGNIDDLIVVALGADSSDDRFQEVKGLVDWSYENFKW